MGYRKGHIASIHKHNEAEYLHYDLVRTIIRLLRQLDIDSAKVNNISFGGRLREYADRIRPR